MKKGVLFLVMVLCFVGYGQINIDSLKAEAAKGNAVEPNQVRQGDRHVEGRGGVLGVRPEQNQFDQRPEDERPSGAQPFRRVPRPGNRGGAGGTPRPGL